MVTSAIHEAHLASTLASVGTSTAAEEATSHVGGTNGEGRGAVAPGMSGAEVSRWGRERLGVEHILRR